MEGLSLGGEGTGSVPILSDVGSLDPRGKRRNFSGSLTLNW